MALDKNSLERSILDALQFNLDDNAKSQKSVTDPLEAYARALADAIHTYVRTGKVNVPGEGNKPVR